MSRSFAVVLLAMQFLWAAAIYAGGASETVSVLKLQRTGPVSYFLIVEPVQDKDVSGYGDPYMNRCSRFIVHGTFDPPPGGFPEFVTRASHLDALRLLESALDTGRKIELGWMGSGFGLEDPNRPCEVRSKALMLWHRNDGRTSVVSFHNSV